MCHSLTLNTLVFNYPCREKFSLSLNLTFSCSADCPWTLQYPPSRKTWLHLLPDPFLGRLERAKRWEPAPQPLVSSSVRGNNTQQGTESFGMPGRKGRIPSTRLRGWPDSLLSHFPGTFGVNHSRLLKRASCCFCPRVFHDSQNSARSGKSALGALEPTDAILEATVKELIV